LNTPDLTRLEGMTLDANEPVFNEPWEAQAFALVIGLYEKGAFTWNEWADVLSKTIHSDNGNAAYYELWLVALEAIVLKKSLANENEILERKSDWQKALLATPHGEPIELKTARKS
jgi:nitrile hydratase accessory protein